MRWAVVAPRGRSCIVGPPAGSSFSPNETCFILLFLVQFHRHQNYTLNPPSLKRHICSPRSRWVLEMILFGFPHLLKTTVTKKAHLSSAPRPSKNSRLKTTVTKKAHLISLKIVVFSCLYLLQVDRHIRMRLEQSGQPLSSESAKNYEGTPAAFAKRKSSTVWVTDQIGSAKNLAWLHTTALSGFTICCCIVPLIIWTCTKHENL